MTTPTAVDDVMARAGELAAEDVAPAEAGSDLLGRSGGDRRTVEAARDRVAAQLRAHVDDYASTATLTLLNRVLAQLPIDDPLDWRVRWTQRFRRP